MKSFNLGTKYIHLPKHVHIVKHKANWRPRAQGTKGYDRPTNQGPLGYEKFHDWHVLKVTEEKLNFFRIMKSNYLMCLKQYHSMQFHREVCGEISWNLSQLVIQFKRWSTLQEISRLKWELLWIDYTKCKLCTSGGL